MNKTEAIKIYKDNRKKYYYYYYVLGVFNYDDRTIAPSKSNDYRSKVYGYLSGEIYSLTTDPKYIEVVTYLSKLDLGEELNRQIYLSNRDLQSSIKLCKQDVLEAKTLHADGMNVWADAKNDDDYNEFEPILIKLIKNCEYITNKTNPGEDTYDALLDKYEQGTNKKTYDKFFALIKKELVPLIKAVNNRQDVIDDSFLYKHYDIDKQRAFCEDYLLDFLNYDNSWGYISETMHPFTEGMSIDDVRITTKYDENNITSTIFSIIHEVGHAYYEHNVNKKYESTEILRSISMGMHESQSRFLENNIGRRRSFWVKLYPILQSYFPENLKDVTLDQFYLAINASKSSLIRTEADELTYPIHILIRYEIEKELFMGKADIDNLDKLWNKKYKEYLGVDVDKDSNGILQDIHWSDASFGYFPTYALGSAIAAQLAHTMEKQIDIDGLLEKGQFKKIMNYLKENVHQYGALYDYNQILLKATGEKFNPKYYIAYLKNKYKKLYKIKRI